MRTATEIEALRIVSEILHPHEWERGEARRRDTARSIRDVAAAAGGMVHRDGHLLTRLPATVLLRSRTPIADGPCLINGFRGVDELPPLPRVGRPARKPRGAGGGGSAAARGKAGGDVAAIAVSAAQSVSAKTRALAA